jgi:hypothetical protein
MLWPVCFLDQQRRAFLPAISAKKRREDMIIKKEAKRLMLQLFCLAILAFLGLGTWAVADGPVADFPSFIPFDIAKTGDVAVDKVGNVYVNRRRTL